MRTGKAVQRLDCGDCRHLMKREPDKSVNVIVTSPPYAEQADDEYEGCEEEGYSASTVDWMQEPKRILNDDGSLFIIIRPHLTPQGESRYVERMHTAIQDDGWTSVQTLIWLKPDGIAQGENTMPRASYEYMFWYAKTPKPFRRAKAGGIFTNRIGAIREKANPDSLKSGIARIPDVFRACIGQNDHVYKHPRPFPVDLGLQLLRLCTDEEHNVVLDPFCGCGPVIVAANMLGLFGIGFDLEQKFIDSARRRLVDPSEYQIQWLPALRTPAARTKYIISEFGEHATKKRLLVFKYIVSRTIDQQLLEARIGLKEIEEATNIERKTVKNSIDWLKHDDVQLIVSRRDPASHLGNMSFRGVHPRLLGRLPDEILKATIIA